VPASRELSATAGLPSLAFLYGSNTNTLQIHRSALT